MDGWTYEAVPLQDVRTTNGLLVRILIAKIIDEKQLVETLQQVPVVQGDPNWRCRTWITSALAQIAMDGHCVGTAELDWQKIEAFARQYVGTKIAAGRYGEGADMAKPRPMWDLLENRENIP